MTNKKEQAVMYLGPVVRGVVKNGAVFSGGIPGKLEKLTVKKPFIKHLVVPLSEIVRVKAAIAVEGTVEAVAYKRLEAISEGEIKEIMEGE